MTHAIPDGAISRSVNFEIVLIIFYFYEVNKLRHFVTKDINKLLVD